MVRTCGGCASCVDPAVHGSVTHGVAVTAVTSAEARVPCSRWRVPVDAAPLGWRPRVLILGVGPSIRTLHTHPNSFHNFVFLTSLTPP